MSTLGVDFRVPASETSLRFDGSSSSSSAHLGIVDWLAARDAIDVISWDDPLVERVGHAPRGLYVETYWLPVIGPSATWAMRRLSTWLEASPEGYRLTLTEFAQQLGLGGGTGRNSPVVKTVVRLVRFGFATRSGDNLAARRAVAPLTHRQVASLPPALSRAHAAEAEQAPRCVTQRPGAECECVPLCHSASPASSASGAVVRSGKPATASPAAPTLAVHPIPEGDNR